MNQKVRIHLFISGRVQGVFFRHNTRQKAKELGTTGWIKNLPDGRVEAIFEGEKDKIEKIIEWAKRGPIFAQVNNIEIVWEKFKNEFEDFNILI